MENEKEWLEQLRSRDNKDVWKALEKVTPELSEKYKYEIISKSMTVPLGFHYLPTEILEQWPDLCIELSRKEPKYIGLISEEVIKSNPDIIDGITSEQWEQLITEGRYRHIPLEIFEEKKELIFEKFEMRKDSAARLSNEICEKHPDTFARAIKAMKADEEASTSYLKATFPPEFLDKYKEEMEKLDKVSETRARYLKMIKEAESLLYEVNEEIYNVERSVRSSVNRQNETLREGMEDEAR